MVWPFDELSSDEHTSTPSPTLVCANNMNFMEELNWIDIFSQEVQVPGRFISPCKTSTLMLLLYS